MHTINIRLEKNNVCQPGKPGPAAVCMHAHTRTTALTLPPIGLWYSVIIQEFFCPDYVFYHYTDLQGDCREEVKRDSEINRPDGKK